MYLMIQPLKNFADFSGRATRKEYWLFQLLISALIGVITSISIMSSDTYGSIVLYIFVLFVFVPTLAVAVRRSHDLNRSGWIALLTLIPVANIGVQIYFCFRGTSGDNRFGPDPLQEIENLRSKDHSNQRSHPSQALASEVRQSRGIEKVTRSNKKAGWSEEFRILNRYDPIVKACHDELEELDPQLSSQFREEVVLDRKNSSDIRNRLKAEHEKKIKPYASESLNDALAEARLRGPSAEKEFSRIVEVMGEDLDLENVLQRFKEKYSFLTPPEDMVSKLEYWGIVRVDNRFLIRSIKDKNELWSLKHEDIESAVAFVKYNLDDFFKKASVSTLKGVLSSCGYDIKQTSDGENVRVIIKNGDSVTLKPYKIQRYIRERITPKEIRQCVDYIILHPPLG